MPASAVPSPTASTRARTAEPSATVPAATRSPRPRGQRARLAGEHRLVEVGLTLDEGPVCGNARAGPNQHDVAGAQIGGGDPARLAVLDPLGLVGEQLR